MKARPYIYAGTVALAAATGIGLWTSQLQAVPPSAPKVPALQVDPNWPKMPLPSAATSALHWS